MKVHNELLLRPPSASKVHRNRLPAINLKIATNPVGNDCVVRHLPYQHISHQSFCGRKVLDSDNELLLRPTSAIKVHRNRPEEFRVLAMNRDSKSQTYSFDVVIIGAGIIGLSIARQFLLGSKLSVAVLDAAVPCSGATGAGTQSLLLQNICMLTHDIS